MIKMDIKILGTGCPKCKTLWGTTRVDIVEIMKYSVISTPALVVINLIKSNYV
jgi:hypothetical protein